MEDIDSRYDLFFSVFEDENAEVEQNNELIVNYSTNIIMWKVMICQHIHELHSTEMERTVQCNRTQSSKKCFNEFFQN